jgi:phosphohistidine phosphatase
VIVEARLPGLDREANPVHSAFMELYLLRHGIAADRNPRRFPHDSHRPLTEEGIARTCKVAQALAALKTDFSVVLTSPYVRARQTADIMVEELRMPGKPRLCDSLAPGGRAGELIAEVKRVCKRRDSRVLLVGHEPDLSRLASLLISGRPDADLTLKKAGLCVLQTDDLTAGRCASLQLLLTPKLMLRTLK